MQTIEVTIPVPRGYGVAQALAWAAGEFDRFCERGWQIRNVWTLELGEPATLAHRGRAGRLVFVAEGGAGDGAGGDGRGLDSARARLVVRSDGSVVLDGAWPDGVRAQLLAVLGDRVAW